MTEKFYSTMLAIFYQVLFLFSGLCYTSGDPILPSINAIHPFYVSVTEVNHNSSDKTLEIACKIFTDDFEVAIAKAGHRVDLINPVNKAQADKQVSAYLSQHLQFKLDGKPVKLEFLGFERESEAVWSYLQVSNVTSPKKVEILNALLFESFAEQINLLHVTVGGNRKSTRLNNPNSVVKFDF